MTATVDELRRGAEVVVPDDLVRAQLDTRLFASEADDVRRLGTREPADDSAGGAGREIAMTIEKPNGIVRAKLVAHGCVHKWGHAPITVPCVNWIRRSRLAGPVGSKRLGLAA